MASYLDRSGLAANLGRGLALAGLAAGMAMAADGGGVQVSGFAWTQFQSGLTPMYKGAANFDYNPFFNTGGLVFLNSKPSDNWELDLGLGVAYANSAIKKTLKDTLGEVVGKTNPNSISLGMYPFVYHASVNYKAGNYALKVGKFHYTYSDYNHNMGLYLLRGPVYPGFLYSGFDEIPAMTKTGLLSSWVPMENLKWDVLATFETDFKPYMDINLASFVTVTAGLLEIGVGFESQRLVEFNPCITSPEGRDVDNCLGGDPNPAFTGPGAIKDDLYKGVFYVIDTTAVPAGGKPDTTRYSLAGTKVMVRGAFDFKKVLSGYEGGAKDWVAYFEVALIGVKDYPHIYTKKGERMPMLFGVNIPTYGLLDLFSLEAEYYNSPYQNDPYKLVGAYDVFKFSDGNAINYAMSPIPPSSEAQREHLFKTQRDFDPKKDNLKWSLYLTKKVVDRITFKGQVASDHWRVPNNNFVMYEAAAAPGQFYGSLKVEYGL